MLAAAAAEDDAAMAVVPALAPIVLRLEGETAGDEEEVADASVATEEDVNSAASSGSGSFATMDPRSARKAYRKSDRIHVRHNSLSPLTATGASGVERRE